MSTRMREGGHHKREDAIMKDDLLRTFNYFVTRDLVYILGGGAVILSFLYYFDRLPSGKMQTAAFLFGAGLAHVIGFAVQDLLSLFRIVTTKDEVMPKFPIMRKLYYWFTGEQWNVQQGDLKRKKLKFMDKASVYVMGEFQRIVTLRMIGTAVGPCLALSSILVFLRYLSPLGKSFDLALALSLCILGLGLMLLGRLQGYEQTRFVYEWDSGHEERIGDCG